MLHGKGGIVITGNLNLSNLLSEQASKTRLVTFAVWRSKTRKATSWKYKKTESTKNIEDFCPNANTIKIPF